MLRLSQLLGFYARKIVVPIPLLIDITGGSAKCAYGLRKLRVAYSGSAIRIRRASDNTEQDIGFIGEDLDWASAISFKGASTVFIVKWYDQSGHTLDLIQATSASQPQLDTVNHEIDFDGSNDFLQCVNVDLSATNKVSIFFVARSSDTSTQVFVEHGTTGSENNIVFFSFSTVMQNAIHAGSNYYEIASFNTGLHELISSIIDRTLSPATDIIKLRRNASTSGITNIAATIESGNFSNLNLNVGMRNGGSFPVNGSMKELVIFDTDGTANRAAIEANINAYHTIY